ncbi:hypothetical protein [Flavobacterium nitrogenifigens]|uniref:TonB-dependent outer membrane receptor, SusC/RagA subfamily, signature region n=1 Tax=Flavobacterium nitrogenifigens TaxID=1617283 RepID=A0A521DGX1_9FLAO|nr:hypothetical protein [Flavobacterium nitrogenifigens]KAF2330103.1 hypothetical protein DM397_15345 [Flavobacterium nitrogenifigens]SMO70878.1 hypothetical protein SAMN06265220_10348 [Flavobacterium nitrogenifigens]
MDNQDKLFDKIKEASQKAEFQDFPGMEKVWARVEEKLDKKEDKRTIALWKKIAVAASLLLLLSLGFQFLHSNKETITETPKVVLEEKEIKQLQTEEPIVKQNDATSSGIVSNEEAVKILDNQTKKKERVAIQEEKDQNNEAVVSLKDKKNIPAPFYVPPVAASTQEQTFEEEDNIVSKKEVAPEMGYSSYPQRESAKVAYSAAPTQRAKKSSPLVVLNGNAMAHSNDAKKDKMMQDELPNLDPENVDSLVVLDEPLYIIDGIYYSENDLFGKNPTSPYAPLDKQDIKTITILQDLEATEKYGERGKKGVVIIITKNGKPTPKK